MWTVLLFVVAIIAAYWVGVIRTCYRIDRLVKSAPPETGKVITGWLREHRAH